MADILKIKVNDEWQSVIAIKGDTGASGTDGDDGFSPIATVSKSGTTSTITITDAVGTTTAQVTDGDDYILTNQDKQDIADLVLAELVDGEEMQF